MIVAEDYNVRKEDTKNAKKIQGEDETSFYYRIIFLNHLSFPLKGGYFTDGSNQVGVSIIAFL